MKLLEVSQGQMIWGQFHMNWDSRCRALVHGCGHSGCNQCGMKYLRNNQQGLECGKVHSQRLTARGVLK